MVTEERAEAVLTAIDMSCEQGRGLAKATEVFICMGVASRDSCGMLLRLWCAKSRVGYYCRQGHSREKEGRRRHRRRGHVIVVEAASMDVAARAAVVNYRY